MTDDSNGESIFATPNRDSSGKQRKVRKGTHSCWECKRRKIRCIFPTFGDVACIGCQRRRTTCVSQDMPEALSPARKGNRYLSERIARVEDVVKGLATGMDVSMSNQAEEEPRQDGDANDLRTRIYDAMPSVGAPPTPAESNGGYTPYSSLLTPDTLAALHHAGLETTAIHYLQAAIPADHDVKIILRESPRSSRYTSLVYTQPHSKLTLETLDAPYPTTQFPPPDAHPITLARCMLIFAITLQSPCEEDFLGHSEPPSIFSRKLVSAATAWLSNEEITHNTIDGLVCIILEAVFETNCGNLRRAWIVYRRAITIAQMMGLHRSPMPSLKRIDPALDADPEFMWFRIVYMDRYLSLLLGLPQGTLDKSTKAMSTLQHETALGRFERQLTVIASSILERNDSAPATNDVTMTQSIDSDLLRVSKSMPAGFWRPANFQTLVPGSPQALLESVRLSAQVYCFGLLIQLHLPYMMIKVGDSTNHEYSKITCANASREIITRFIAHRSFNPRSSCSRPVDFFTLLGAMTLLLAHLDTHHYQGVTNLLAHQRLSDRAILEQTLERMDAVSDVGKDIVLEKSAILIRRLLDLEADAAEENDYTTESVRMNEDGAQEGVGRRDGELRLHIPYLGGIKIALQSPMSREPLTSQAEHSRQEPIFTTSAHASPSSPHTSSPDQQQQLSNLHDMTQDSTSPGDLSASDSLNVQSQTARYDEQWNVDDWILQGVDMAFFDSLMKGVA